VHLAESEMGDKRAALLGNWHAVFTRHQHEKSVASVLSKKNYDAFLPLYRSVRHWQDRAKSLWLPLFPCYVFVREGMDRPLQILTTPGVVHIVKCGGQPAIVPQGQLDVIRRLVESSLRVECHPYLGCGDRVRIKTGPLTGLEGILTRQKGIARLVVSIEMLGRSAAVEIDRANVEGVAPITTAVPAHVCPPRF
jgi:transcription antitermination factor NusG